MKKIDMSQKISYLEKDIKQLFDVVAALDVKIDNLAHAINNKLKNIHGLTKEEIDCAGSYS